jgi:uncharacterized protein (TIGR02246 family)
MKENEHHSFINNSSLEKRLQQLEDREAIRTLIAKYCLLVDSRDIEQVAMLFTCDGRFASSDGKIESRGRPQIVEQFHRRYAVLGPSNHFVHESVIEFNSEDPDIASGWVNSHAEVVRHGSALWAALRYHDRYRREEGQWRFEERLLHFFYYLTPKEYPDALGDLYRNRAYTEPLAADYPEKLASWRAYYAKHPQKM